MKNVLKLRWVFLAIAIVAPAASPLTVLAGESGGAIHIGASGPFDLYSLPLLARDGLVATTIRVKTRDELHRIDTVRLFALTGAVHQAWARDEDDFDGETYRTPLASQYVTVAGNHSPTNNPDDFPRASVIDSYILPPCDTQLECAFVGSIVENNDESNPLAIEKEPFGTLDGRVDNYKLVLGIGDLYMPTAESAIVYSAGDRPNWLNIAVAASTADASGLRPSSPVYIAFEVLGRDVLGNPLSATGRFGLDGELLSVAFVPEPSAGALAVIAGGLLAGVCWRMRKLRP